MGSVEGPRRSRDDAAVMMTEGLTRLAKELTKGANDTIAQLNGGLIAQQRLVEGYQALLTDANLAVKALQDEVGELKKSNLEARRLELDFEMKRSELALREQRIQGLLLTLRDVGGAVVQQFMSARRPGALPLGASAPTRPVEVIIMDIWPRLSAETIERLKAEAGTDLVLELLTRVTEQQSTTNVQAEVRQ